MDALKIEDLKYYIEAYNLKKVNLLGHSMGGKVAMLFSVTYPELVSKLIVADIGPKYYAPHHQTILAALNAVDFSLKPARSNVEEIISNYIKDIGTRQFLLKNLYWKTPEQLAFRFNLAVFNKKIETIGTVLPFNNSFSKDTLFLRGDKSDYILDADFETIYHHFPKAIIKTINNSGHWLHAENPKDFYQYTMNFIK